MYGHPRDRGDCARTKAEDQWADTRDTQTESSAHGVRLAHVKQTQNGDRVDSLMREMGQITAK